MIKFLNKKWFYYLIAALYSLLFCYGYINFLYVHFEYAGYNMIRSHTTDFPFLLLSIFMSVAPLSFFKGVRSISGFLCVFIYFILYVPIILTYFFDFKGSVNYVIFIQLLYMTGMSLLFTADRITLEKKIIISSKANAFKIILILTVLSTIYMIVKYRGNLQFVGFEDVYDQRFANIQLGADTITAYLSSWLAYFMVPVCLTYGFFSKRRIFIIVGIVASIIIYMATASKTALVFPPVIYLLFRALRHKNLKSTFSIIGVGLILVMFISLLFDFNIFTSLLWMRAIGNSGSLTVRYHEFFQNNPHTYYTHINIINLVADAYPYGEKSLGQVIGSQYYGPLTNANANFWATDGFVAIGDWGILLSSFFLFFIFVIFNKIASKYNLIFVILVLIPFLVSLLNMSMFSSLLSGGAIFSFLLLMFKSSIKNKFINETHNHSRG